MIKHQTPSEIIRRAIDDGPRWLCQKSVARQAGISEKHLSQIVRGAVRMSARVAVQLEVPLGVPALDLLIAQALVDIAAVKADRRRNLELDVT
jgi:plasmid maintenance system antidote protein VapI